MALKELEARYATIRAKDYKLTDGEGLYLLVRANGSKLWRFKYRYAGKEKLLSFGPYPDTSLADARLRRAEAKVALGQGVDPGAKEKALAVTTFEQAARAWHANRLEALDAGHASRLLTRLENDAFPMLGASDLRHITSADVLAIVRQVEARGALDVSRWLKQHVSQIYRFAITQGWADIHPTQHQSGLLKPKPQTRHMARIGVDELPQLFRVIDRYDGDETPKRRAVTRAALMFTLLTLGAHQRTSACHWDEFDGLDGAEPIWQVAAVVERDISADMIDSTVVRAHHCAVGLKKGIRNSRGSAVREAASRPSCMRAVMVRSDCCVSS